MQYILVCPIGVIGGSHDLLTYHTDTTAEVGAIITVPFGHRTVRAVILQHVQKPTFVTKPIISILSEVVSPELISLAQWIAEYYAARLPTVWQTILPAGLGKKRRHTHSESPALMQREKTAFTLTTEQTQAINTIHASSSITHLLHGVTGSGKTTVYKELARSQLAQDKSVLILVPEIALTSQLAAEFSGLSHNVAILHSGLTESERHLLWTQIADSTQPWVVIGPRSALFCPVRSIGLIVIDECHEPSYIQDSQPKYSALRVARKLAEIHHAKLVLGSATPAISDYYIAKETKAPIITLPRAISTRKPRIQVIDMRDRSLLGSHSIFSRPLLSLMKQTLGNNKQVMLFHNRRGTARMGLCSSCGWVATCPNCELPLRLHHDLNQLHCHLCGTTSHLALSCPECRSTDIVFQGYGSKRIEQEVKKLYPQKVVARFDSDTLKGEQLHERYQDVYDGKIDIIIGTQSIAKGLDLPHLDLVGIVQADSELFIPDFASSERSFQLITQVIGRVGRAGQKSDVVIQTFNPDHSAIVCATEQDYQKFYETEIIERRLEHVSPFTFLLQLTTGYASAQSAKKAAEKLKLDIRAQHPRVHVRGPSPSFHEKRGNKYYSQLIVSSSSRKVLVEIARALPTRWQFTLDPINLM